MMCVLLNGKKQKARPTGANLKVRWRAKFAMLYRCGESARRAILVWNGVIDRRGDQLGKGERCWFGKVLVSACGFDPSPRQGNP